MPGSVVKKLLGKATRAGGGTREDIPSPLMFSGRDRSLWHFLHNGGLVDLWGTFSNDIPFLNSDKLVFGSEQISIDCLSGVFGR